jgi:hypothetical protein
LRGVFWSVKNQRFCIPTGLLTMILGGGLKIKNASL